MIYYFSGTGNSLWAAREIAKHLQMPMESIAKYRKEPQVICDDDVVGFAFPTYMSDLPWVVKEFLLKLEVKKDAYVFVIMTSSCGKSGKAGKSLDQALHVHGAALSALFDLQMPGNCGKSSIQENMNRLRVAPVAMKHVFLEVDQRRKNFHSDGSLPKKHFVESSYLYGNHSLKRFTFMKNLVVSSKCDRCAICAQICPMDNIVIREVKAVHKDQCAGCYACLHWCPNQATILNVPTMKKNVPYHHPEITVSDLIKAKKIDH